MNLVDDQIKKKGLKIMNCKSLLIIILLYSSNIFGAPHPNIPLKYLQVKDGLEATLLEEIIEMDKSELRFEKRNGKYVVFIYDNFDQERFIDSFEEDREILSVFFYEISGDNLKEIFMITRYKGKYEIFSYGVAYDRSYYFFERLDRLNKVLNNRFKDSKKLNAAMVRSQIKGKLPLDYASLEYWPKSRDAFYKGTDFLKGEFLGYYNSDGNKVTSSSEAAYYLKRYKDNIYGKFYKVDSFSLTEVFEGQETIQPPYYIKHGKYRKSYLTGYIEGSYVNNIEHGYWESNERMHRSHGRYNMGRKTGYWQINEYNGNFVDDLQEGLWKREDGLEEKVYQEGTLKESRTYNRGDKKLVEETIYNRDGSYVTKEYLEQVLVKRTTQDNRGGYRREEYNIGGSLTYLTKDDGARVKMNPHKDSYPKSIYEPINWDEVEYLGELKVYGQVSFSYAYLLTDSKSVNSYKAKIFMKNLEGKNIFFMVVQKDGSSYYRVHEIFEGKILRGSFPTNIVREGRSEVFNRSKDIIEISDYISNKLNGRMVNYSSENIYQEIEFNQGKIIKIID